MLVEQGNERHRARGFLAASGPDRLRLELHDPMGSTSLVLVLAPTRSRLVARDGYAEDELADELLARILGRRVACASLVSLLLGDGDSSGRLADGVRYERVRDRPGPPASIKLEVADGPTLSLELSDREPLRDKVAAFALPAIAGLRPLAEDEVRVPWRKLE